MSSSLTGRNLLDLALMAIMAAVLVAVIITTSLTRSTTYRVFAYIVSVIIVGVFIYGAVSQFTETATTTSVSPQVASTRDPFTYDPGETANGTVVFSGNASALPTQYMCNLKSMNTVYENGKCNCKTGFYGDSCQYEGFDDSYVSLTTSTVYSATSMPSQTAPVLSTWPNTTTDGCTNICTSNPMCIAVTYSNRVCTQISALSFPSAPIQTDIDPPVLDTTLYINKSRLLAVNLQGYFNVIYGLLPVRYFVGNGITSATSTNVHVTDNGTRIGYYPIGVQSSFAGIPDWIIVGTPGTLYISPNQIPPAGTITQAQGTLVALTAPLALPKASFPFSGTSSSYFVRLDGP